MNTALDRIHVKRSAGRWWVYCQQCLDGAHIATYAAAMKRADQHVAWHRGGEQ